MFFGEPFGGLVPGSQGAALEVLLRTDAPLTGRQIHGLLRSQHSLWSVQQALKTLTQLGLVDIQTVGRANIHSINEDHAAVGPLRSLLDPVAALMSTVSETVDENVRSVLVFGSIARGRAHRGSDVDLAVIASDDWEGRLDLEEAVHKRLGNNCDVVVFTPEQFQEAAMRGEPLVTDLRSEGIVVHGDHLP